MRREKQAERRRRPRQFGDLASARAIETSVIVANTLGVEYEIAEALREYDVGVLEGRADEEAWGIWKALFDDWTEFRRYSRRIDGGESFYDVQNRFVPFVDGLVREHSRADENVLCVAHGGLYWMMLPLVLQNVDTAFIARQNGFGYTALVVAEWRREGLICVEWNGINV